MNIKITWGRITDKGVEVTAERVLITDPEPKEEEKEDFIEDYEPDSRQEIHDYLRGKA